MAKRTPPPVSLACIVAFLSMNAYAANGSSFEIPSDQSLIEFGDSKTIVTIEDVDKGGIGAIGDGTTEWSSTVTGKDLSILVGEYNTDNLGEWTTYGILAQNGTTVNLGSQSDRFSNVSIQNHGVTTLATGIRVWRGNPAKHDAHVNIHSNVVDINVHSDEYWAYGIQAFNSTTDSTIAEKDRSSVVIDANVININASSGIEEQSVGIIAWSQAKVKLTADQINISAYKILNTRGDAITEINSEGNENSIVKLNGNIDFEFNGTNSGTSVNAKVDIKLMNADSYWKGNTMTTVSGTPNEGDLDTTGFSLTLANGATWISTESSFVNQLTLDHGVLDVQGDDNHLSVDHLFGTTGDVKLSTRMIDGKATANSLTIGTVSATTESINIAFDGINTDQVSSTEDLSDLMAKSIKVESPVPESFTQTGTIEEGAINGAIAVEKDSNGNVISQTRYQNQKLTAFSSANVINLMQWRHEMNNLTKRMGDLRSSAEGVGSWVRLYGSEQEYGAKSTQTKNTSIQVGADYDVGANWKVGAAFSYTDSSSTMFNGSADGDLYGFAVYGTWFNDDGQFVDLIAKYSRLSNDFTAGEMSGSYDNNAYSVSAEYGWHFKVNDIAFVEPQVELTYGQVMGDDFTSSNNVLVEQDDVDSFVGRVGVRGGFYFPENKGNIYLRASVLHDFNGETSFKASQDTNSTTITEDIGGTWYEFGVGGNFNLTENTYTYVDLEKTTGGDVKENWQWNIGLRHVW